MSGFRFVKAHNKQQMRLTITICQSQYYLTEESRLEGDWISHQQIKARVDIMLQKHGLSHKVPQMFFLNHNKNEERLRGEEKFKHDVQIVVRFENDFKLMQQQIQALTSTYQDLINSLSAEDPDVFKLNSTPPLGDRKISMLYTTQPDVELCVLVSNPLVRHTPDGLTRVDRTPIHISELERSLRKCLTWTQPIFVGEITVASKSRIESCKHGNAKILQFMCDTEINEHTGKPEFVLESDEQPGLEQCVPVEEVFEGSQRPSLVVIVGRNASVAGRVIEKLDMDCVAINSAVFEYDRPANHFLELFYQDLYRSRTLEDAFHPSVKDAIKKQIKPNELCCCYHGHSPTCDWLKIVKLIGHEAAHLEMHQLHGGCIKKKCLSGCDDGKAIMEQIKPADEYEERPSCLNLCCCFYEYGRADNHQETNKFWLFDRKKWRCTPGQRARTDITLKVPCMKLGLTNDVLDQDYIIGRNSFLYELVKLLSDQNSGNVLKLCEAEGKNTDILRFLTKNAVAYLMQRNFPVDFVQIDLKGVVAEQDFLLKLKEKLSERTFKIQELLMKIEGKKLVVLFYNIEEYLQRPVGQAHFVKSVTEFINNFIQKQDSMKANLDRPRASLRSNLKVLFVKECQSESKNQNLLGEKTLEMKGLDVASAVDFYLRKSAIKDKNDNATSFLSENRRIQFVYDTFLGIQSRRALNEDLLERITNGIKKSVPFRVSAQKQLNEWGNSLYQTRVYEAEISVGLTRLLLFIKEFNEGLSEKDLGIMASIESFSGVVPKDWKALLLDQMKKEGSADQKLSIGKYFYFDVVKKRDCQFLQVKAKGQRLRQSEGDPQLGLRALQYLSIYTIILIKLLRQRHDYHEHLFEYSNVTQTGIFYYRKFQEFRDFFDEGEYLPAQKRESGMAESAKGRRIRYYEGEIFALENKLLEGLTPDRAHIQHQDNFLSVYLMRDKIKRAPDKYIYHYYYSLLLNIPTLMLMMAPKVSWQLVSYCIDHSLECALILPPEGHQMTQGLLLLKLYYMDIGLKRITKSPSEYIQVIHKYNDEIDKILQIWTSKKKFELRAVNRIEDSIRLLLAESDGRNEPADPAKFLSDLSELYELLQQSRKKIMPINFELISARIALYTAQMFRLIPIQYKQEMELCRPIKQLKADLLSSRRNYADNDNVLLLVRARLSTIDLEIKQVQRYHPNKNEKAFIEKCSDIKREIDSIAVNYFYEDKQQTKIADQATISFFERLVFKTNSLIWNFCSNLFVFMKSEPLTTSRTCIRAPSIFKKQVETLFESKQLNIATIFRTLTKSNLQKIVQNGCLLLVLTVDCESPSEDSISLILEDQSIPSPTLLPLSQLRKSLYDSGIDTIIVCGVNSRKLVDNIAKSSNGKKYPSLIALQTNTQDFGLDSAQCYFIQRKQQEIITKFIRIYCERLLREDQAVARHTKYFFEKCEEEASKKLSKSEAECLEKYMFRKFVASNRSPAEIMKVQFARGSYKDASGQLIAPHNLSKQADSFQKTDQPAYKPSVGRQTHLLSILRQLTNEAEVPSSGDKNSPLWINIFGGKGMGKKTLLTDVAWELALKNIYEDGVFLIDCNDVVPEKDRSESKESEQQAELSEDPKLMSYCEQQVGVLFRKLQENRQQKIVVFLCNVNRLINFESDEFLKVAEEKKVRVVFSSTHKFKNVRHKLLLGTMTREEAAAMIYTYISPSYVFTRESLDQGLEQRLLSKIIEPGTTDFVPAAIHQRIAQCESQFPQMIMDTQQQQSNQVDEWGVSICRSRKLSGDGSIFTSQRLQGSSHIMMEDFRVSELDSMLATSSRPSYSRRIPVIAPSGKRYDDMNSFK